MRNKFFLLMLMSFCLFGGKALAQTFTQGNLKYTVIDAGAKTVSVAKASNDITGAIVIPSTVTEGGVTYTVTETAAGAFHNCTGITAITVPASVNTVRRGFVTSCSALKKLTINDSSTPLAFVNNWGEYPQGNEQFCVADLDYFYLGRDIEAVEVNKNIVKSVKEIKLGGKMTTIPGWFSDENKALTKVTIGGNITKIGQEAFDQNTSLASVTITSPVDTLLQSAFWGCTSLTKFDIPATVKYLGPAVFRNCTALGALTIPAGTEHITRGLITGCTGLKKLTIANSETPLYFENNWAAYPNGNNELAIASCLDEYYQGRDITVVDEGYKIVTSAKKIELGGSMTAIPSYFTQSDTALTTLIIGDNITKIGQSAFDSNTRLTSVTITAPVDTMLQSAFWGCTALESFKIPATVKYLGPAVFRNCTALKALTIPAATEHVTRGLVTGCTGLKKLTIANSDKPLLFENNWAAYPQGNNELAIASCLDEYYQGRDITVVDEGYKIVTSAKKIELGGSMTAIPEHFTEKDTALTTLIIGDNITKIGYVAFSEDTRLNSVTFNAPVDTINQSAFWGCTALEAIELPSTVKYLGPAVFRNCTALKALTIPAATEHVTRGLVTGCTSLKTFTIEDSDKPLFFENNWGAYPQGNNELCVADLDYFYMGRDVDRTEPENILVTSAKKIKVAGNVTAVPGYFTKNNKALTEVLVQGDMTKISYQAFCYCENLNSVTLDAPIDTIRYEAFYGCSSLPAIALPQEVKCIERGAFFNCKALSSFTIPAATEYVERGIFTNCPLKSLTIEDSSKPLAFVNNWGTYPTGNNELCVADVLEDLYVGRTITQTEANRLVSKAKNLTFGQPVTEIGTLYNNVSGIATVTVPWQTPLTIAANAFSDATYQSALLRVPGGTKQAYAAAEGWKKFLNVETWSVIVKLTASAHGSIATKYGTASNGNTIQFNQPKDEPLVYTITADNGYKLSALTDNGTAVSPLPALGVAQSRAIGSDEENITLSATFAPVSYTITYDLAGGALPSGKTNRTSYNIETATFTLNNPTRDHYDFAGWTGTGLTAPTKTVTIAKGSTGNRSYKATWEKATYTVTITGAGVTASNYSPKYGESVVITIEDDPDRSLQSLTVNGTDVTSQVKNNKYTITNVSSNIEVVATFVSTKEFITLTGEYAMFSCPQDLDFTGSSLRAYIASGFNKATSQVLLTPVTDVPAGTGIFLIGTPGQTYKIPYSESTSIYMNFFQANLTKKTISATTGNFSNYTFGEQGGDPGFYPINGSTTLQAQTAYLQLPTSFVTAGVKVSVVFEDDIIDGMADWSDMSDMSDGSDIYDLGGRRLGKTQRGINIVNGKKVLVK